jgi:Secretion system C-terminal sorting domain/Beta-propeller repeat
MKTYIVTVIAVALFALNVSAQSFKTTEKLYFIQNKGQLRNPDGKPRNDIQYYLQTPEISVFIGDGAIHYQFFKRTPCPAAKVASSLKKPNSTCSAKADLKVPALQFQTEICRTDLSLIGANTTSVPIAAGPNGYHETYYTNATDGKTVASCQKIVYPNIYAGINWVLRIADNKFVQEFEIAADADARQIKMKVNGANAPQLNPDGSFTVSSRLGTVTESAPSCIMPNKNCIAIPFALSGNILSYNVSHLSEPFVIDPVVEWATYYGPDSSATNFFNITADTEGHIYGVGLTWADHDIVTSGAYDTVFTTVANSEAYLAKFDSLGHRLWATYFADSGWGSAIARDIWGNIYIAGSCSGLAGVATPGCAQPFFGGGLWGGFLAKFDTAGHRIWGTYVGGSIGYDFDLEIASVFCDNFGSVYVSGATDDTSNVGTPGTLKPFKLEGMDTTIDAFLIRYDTAGVKQWGTYYGGPGRNQTLIGAGCSDGDYAYLAGWTNDTNNSVSYSISTPLCYQRSNHGSYNGFLAKFDRMGNRLWGTYFGGEAQESVSGIAADKHGNLYMLGATSSDTGIATSGCFQPTRAGSTDAFLVQFITESGYPNWATYYGGPGTENTDYAQIIADDSSNVYITGSTNSDTGIAFGPAWQAVLGGGKDAFLAKYNSAGVLQYGTYYGGSGNDMGFATGWDGKNAYLCGRTNSTDSIATPGSFLSAGGGVPGSFQGFLAKFAPYLYPVSGLQHSEKITGGVFPSPNKGRFTIRIDLPDYEGSASVSVLNTAGKTVFESAYPVHLGRLQQDITLQDKLPNGTYFVKISAAGAISSFIFVKE